MDILALKIKVTPMKKLDPYEMEILAAFEAGKLKSVATRSELARIKAAARATEIRSEPGRGKSIDKASNGSIKIAVFPAQQLGKAPDHYDRVQKGIAEIAYISTGYQAGKYARRTQPWAPG